MKSIVKGIEALSSTTGKLSGYLMIPLTFVIMYTIIMRRFFSNAPDWGFEVPIFIFGISILLMVADVFRFKGHVAVDIINANLSGRCRGLLSTVSLHILL